MSLLPETLSALLLDPFTDFAFMRRALVGCLALALGCGPVGVFLQLRRMTLMSDAMSHAVLPGAALGYVWGGLSLPAMGLGGFVAGLAVALASGLAARQTPLKEDASFAVFYLLALALGVLILSLHGSQVDLMHVLFGSVLAVDAAALLLVAGIASLTLLLLAAGYRLLVAECFDPGFVRASGGGGGLVHLVFLAVVVLNLVAGFQALGTLMAVGLMTIPAATARLWSRQLDHHLLLSVLLAAAAGYCGLVLSFAADLPSGPSIILVAAGGYLLSLLLAPFGLVRPRLRPPPHLEG